MMRPFAKPGRTMASELPALAEAIAKATTMNNFILFVVRVEFLIFNSIFFFIFVFCVTVSKHSTQLAYLANIETNNCNPYKRWHISYIYFFVFVLLVSEVCL